VTPKHYSVFTTELPRRFRVPSTEPEGHYLRIREIVTGCWFCQLRFACPTCSLYNSTVKLNIRALCEQRRLGCDAARQLTHSCVRGAPCWRL
jgi:hypothetical protein